MVKEYKFELEIGHRSLDVMVEAEGTVEEDHNYGADADGNRGIYIQWFELRKMKVFDSMGNDITDKLHDRHKNAWLDLQEEVEIKLNEEDLNE